MSQPVALTESADDAKRGELYGGASGLQTC
jgi:hypothetical protein